MSILIGNPAQIEESNTLRINNKNGETNDNSGKLKYVLQD
jgi:hypothetical protein